MIATLIVLILIAVAITVFWPADANPVYKNVLYFVLFIVVLFLLLPLAGVNVPSLR